MGTNKSDLAWKKFTKLDWWVGGTALLLVIDLAALPWVDVSVGPLSYTRPGTGSPDGFLGILALLAALAVAADVVLARLAPSVKVTPVENFGRTKARLAASAGALALLLLKFMLHLHPSYLGAGCWAALVVGVALVATSYRSLLAAPSTEAANPGVPTGPEPAKE